MNEPIKRSLPLTIAAPISAGSAAVSSFARIRKRLREKYQPFNPLVILAGYVKFPAGLNFPVRKYRPTKS